MKSTLHSTLYLTADGQTEDGPRETGGAGGWKYSRGDVDDLDQAVPGPRHHQVVVAREEPGAGEARPGRALHLSDHDGGGELPQTDRVV